MNLAPDELQTEIGETARALLADRLSFDVIRKLADGEAALPQDEWQALAEMGWLAMLVPEADGGLGLGVAEAVMVARELGRHLTPGPLRSTMLAALLAARSGNLALAAELGSGERKAGLLVGDMGVDAGTDTLILSIGRDECALFEVAAADPIGGIDPGARLSRVTLGQKVCAHSSDSFVATALALVSAELLGVIEAVRDMSASYAQTREQFGKAIGAFQAVKHRCADMAIAAYAVQSQTFLAAVRIDAGCEDALFQAACAHVLAVNFAKRSTADNIQNHGGNGVTAEYNCHLFVRRTMLLEHALGPIRESSFAPIVEPARHEFC
jgi:alkylation response protein AidB-like acyl-CoA dehydrogenase